MPDREIPTLDEILNEPAVDKRINSLIAIAYTNYNSINTINDKLEQFSNSGGYTKKEKAINWSSAGVAAAAFVWTLINYIMTGNSK